MKSRIWRKWVDCKRFSAATQPIYIPYQSKSSHVSFVLPQVPACDVIAVVLWNFFNFFALGTLQCTFCKSEVEEDVSNEVARDSRTLQVRALWSNLVYINVWFFFNISWLTAYELAFVCVPDKQFFSAGCFNCAVKNLVLSSFQAKFNEQMDTIYKMLKSTENIRLSLEVLEPEPMHIHHLHPE